jgi:hypothetical protein
MKEKREKVIVKIMYDRGSWEQLWNAHAFVKTVEWAPLDLPKKEDIPGLELEVIVRSFVITLTAELSPCIARNIPCKVPCGRPEGGVDQ